MNDMINYDKEKTDSERITEKDEELIEIRHFEVGHEDGNLRKSPEAESERCR